MSSPDPGTTSPVSPGTSVAAGLRLASILGGSAAVLLACATRGYAGAGVPAATGLSALLLALTAGLWMTSAVVRIRIRHVDQRRVIVVGDALRAGTVAEEIESGFSGEPSGLQKIRSPR